VRRLELIDPAGKRTQLGGEERFTAPRYSPDGRRIAVAIQAGKAAAPTLGAGSDIWVIDLTTKEATRVTSTGAADSPEWSPDGTRLIYVATLGGRQEVWSTPLDGSAVPARLAETEGDVAFAVPTPDRRSLIVTRWAKGDARLELLRVALGNGSRIDTLVSPTRANDVARYPRGYRPTAPWSLSRIATVPVSTCGR